VATTVAHQLTAKDALRTHLSLELGIDEHAIVSPWAAAGSSALAFSLGAALPLVAILVPPASVRIVIAFVAVLLGLALTGWVSARLGSASKRAAVLRLVFGGAVAMAVTFGIGQLLGTTVG
jgi:VIT1/CCC1 family predicted Fe2+/Mn2+ transporter